MVDIVPIKGVPKKVLELELVKVTLYVTVIADALTCVDVVSGGEGTRKIGGY